MPKLILNARSGAYGPGAGYVSPCAHELGLRWAVLTQREQSPALHEQEDSLRRLGLWQVVVQCESRFERKQVNRFMAALPVGAAVALRAEPWVVRQDQRLIARTRRSLYVRDTQVGALEALLRSLPPRLHNFETQGEPHPEVRRWLRGVNHETFSIRQENGPSTMHVVGSIVTVAECEHLAMLRLLV